MFWQKNISPKSVSTAAVQILTETQSGNIMVEIKEDVMRLLMIISKEDFENCFEKWKGC